VSDPFLPSAQPPALTIQVFYSCPQCGLRKVRCNVPARQNEDVLDWMENTIRLLSTDHALRSPWCHPEQLHDLMIPMAGTNRVGGPMQN